MIKKLQIEQNDTIIYKGKPVNIPIKKDAMIRRSIEMFDDEDPCIIHQSYVAKKFANDLENLFKTENTKTLDCTKYSEQLAFLAIDDLTNTRITILK